MGYKNLLNTYYDKKYKYDSIEPSEFKKIILRDHPQDRFEAAVYWGKASGKALEIGSGSGKVSASLCKYYDEYVATELSTERIKCLKNRFGKMANIKIIQSNIEEQNLNFPPAYFDVIIMISVIEHIIDPISTLKYCYSLLKPGGKIIIHTPNVAKWTRRIKLLFGLFPSTGSLDEGFMSYDRNPIDLHDDGHLHYFTHSSLKKLLKERANFSKVIVYGYGRTFLSRILPTIFSECFIIGIK